MPPSQELKNVPTSFQTGLHDSSISRISSPIIYINRPQDRFRVAVDEFHRDTFASGAPPSMSTTRFNQVAGNHDCAILTAVEKSTLTVKVPHTMHGVRWGCVIELENKPSVWILIDPIFKFVRRPCRREWRQKKERKAKHTGDSRGQSIEQDWPPVRVSFAKFKVERL